MFESLIQKIKTILNTNTEYDLFSLITEEEAMEAIKNIMLREMTQLKKMKEDVISNKDNYKLNISQFYFTRYSKKNNDINMNQIKLFLTTKMEAKTEELDVLQNRDLIKQSLKFIKTTEVNKNRIEKFIYEIEQIIDVFSLNESKKLNLKDKENKNLFCNYVDSFIHGNNKIENHLTISAA